MNRKTVVVLLMFTLVILIGIPESLARPQYYANLNAVYGDGSCGTCHIRASGGGARNDYGTLFENQPNHYSDSGAALRAIGAPTATLTPTSTPVGTETPAEIPEITTVAASGTQAPGFGSFIALAGLIACVLLVRRHKK